MIKTYSFLNQWYIIQTKLFKELKEIIEKQVPKYRCNLTFKSKAFDIVNLDISDIAIVVYNFSSSIRSSLFNYKQFLFHLNNDEFHKDPNYI